MTDAINRPEKESYLLVSIYHGDLASPLVQRYTDWTQDTLGFTSTPSMEADIPENVGNFASKEAKLILPADAFTTSVSDGLRRIMFVVVEEITAGLTGGEAGTRLILFVGRVMRTIRNYQGRSDSVSFFALSAKSRLDVPWGIQCNHHCFWRLFGYGCLLSQATHQKTGQIASIDGKVVMISASASIENPTAPGGTNTRFWERGFLEKGGLQIGVHIWNKDDDPKKFTLRRRPPDSWLLAGTSSILFVPGCHKTIEDCRAVWDNEEQNGSFGYAMLPYQPNYESGQ